MLKFSLETERLYIRNIILEDVGDEYLSWLKNENNKYIVNSNNFINLDDLKKYVITINSNPNVLFLAIFDKIKKKHIGNIKYDPINLKNKYAIMGIVTHFL
jgi:RimJ/RimL family protein N-acetyltransferase